MNKEEIYDEKIFPLMTEIIAICREQGIAMLASYSIPVEDKEGQCCTTHLADGDGEIDERFRAACITIQRGGQSAPPMMLTTQHADGSKTLTAIPG